MSELTGMFKFEFDMQPRIKWTNDATGKTEAIQASWWGQEYDMDMGDFTLLHDSAITSFDTLNLAPLVTVDAAFVTSNGTWSYYTWINPSTGRQIWDLTTLSPFDSGYVGASFEYTYAHGGHVPGGSFLTAATSNQVPTAGALSLLLVVGACAVFGARKR